jgi:large subunit ribosomal protein L21
MFHSWSTAKKPVARRTTRRPDLNTGKTMFAVIKTGGKQYRVTADDEITVMTLPGQAGDKVSFDVLSLFDGDTVEIGAPLVAGATVSGEIVDHDRGPKVIAFKKRRRQNSRRKRGHRQDLTIVRITDVTLNGVSRRAAAPAMEAAAG